MATETRKRVRLGDLLLEKKLISEQQLKEALAEQRRSGRKLGRVPGLKRLFGSTREIETKTELVILLRPIVVDDPEDWPRIIQPAADRLTALGN